jgi:hypothetical protein
MASEAKIAANRANAQKSTGPRSPAGKARTKYNALQHGLAIPRSADPQTSAQTEKLALALAEDYSDDPRIFDLALHAAEAEVEMLRAGRAKTELVNQADRCRRDPHSRSLSQAERGALAFADTVKTLAACGRYERRAFCKRRRLLRKLRAAIKAEKDKENK